MLSLTRRALEEFDNSHDFERMAADIAHALLNRFDRVTAVRVKVEKPEPDGLDAAAEAVELTIARGSRS